MEQYLRDIVFVFRKSPPAMLGLFILVAIVALGVVAPWVAPFDPETPSATTRLLPPNSEHWFGTDTSGFDIFSRTIYAPRVDLIIAISGTALAIALGIPLGLSAGFYGEFVSNVIMRLADVIQAFPTFILALALVAASGAGMTNIIIVIAIINAPIYLRLIRSQVLFLREATFVEAAVSLGYSDRRIMLRHILPSSLPPVLIQASINVGWAILLTGGLAFLGVGIQPPTPEWGSMINIGARNMITGEWWVALFPGLFMAAAMLGFNLVAEALQEAIDPTEA